MQHFRLRTVANRHGVSNSHDLEIDDCICLPQIWAAAPPPLNPCPRTEMRLDQQPKQIRVSDRLTYPRVEGRRRLEDHCVVLKRDSGDESVAGLMAQVPQFEEHLLGRVDHSQ